MKKRMIAGAMLLVGTTFSTEKLAEPPPVLVEKSEWKTINASTPPEIRMFYAIEKYAEYYGIPKKYAYGIAYAETSYEGPFHENYNHKQVSYAGAVGPMQIMPSTAKLMWPDLNITQARLFNIGFNVHTSMKLLRDLHDRYKNWKLVFGCYNTGRPIVNRYAEKVYNHKIKFVKTTVKLSTTSKTNSKESI